MSEVAKAYVQIEPTFEGVKGKIEQAMGESGESGGKKAGSGFGKGFASVIGTVGKVAAGAVAAGGTAVAGIVKTATENYGEFEQLVGGVETLFGHSEEEVEALRQGMLASGMTAAQAAEEIAQISDASDTVMQNAANAYKTAGMSANEYMETVTSFSASLLQSLEGDTDKAASTADMAISDMADNANKMGTSMESIQNAYQGFAKQNYTMLDNLKLGYGGTKQEMERLLEDASELSGIEYNIDSLDDVYNAIHVIQEDMGITGTTAKEASTTIQGSLATLAASWQNVLTGMGDKNADMAGLINILVENAQTFIGNLLPIITQALQSVSTMIAQLAPVIAQELPPLLSSILPMLLKSGAQIIQTLAQGILAAIPEMLPTITEVILSLATMLIEMLPQLIEVGAQVILSLAMGLAQALPDLIPTIINVVLTIVQYLLDNIDLLIDASVQLMIGLAEGLINALPILIEKAPIIIAKLFDAFLVAIPKLLDAGYKMIIMLIDGLKKAWPQLKAQVPILMTNMLKSFLSFVVKFNEVGDKIVAGIKKGISDAWGAFKNWVLGLLDGLVDGIKEFFHIGSPSRLMADEVGQWIPAGIAEGIQQGMGVLNKTIDGMTSDIVMESRVTADSIPQYTGSHDTGSEDELYDLLAKYLPMIADGKDIHITLDGGLDRLFRAMQSKASQYHQTTGQNAFA